MTSAAPGDTPRVRKVFTDRSGGVSAAPYDSFNLGDHVGDAPDSVIANRTRLANSVGLQLQDLIFMEQIHSPTVTEVTAKELANWRSQATSGGSMVVETTDALITTVPGIALVVLTADCVPVLLSDDQAGIVAAVHAGRMGARNGIIPRTIARMEELGAVPGNIHALMGAAASGKKYEVPEHMAEDVESKLPGARTRTDVGTCGLDIRAGLTRQLLSLGVRSIDADPRCTIESENVFSYRREGTTGRQAGMVWLTR